MNISVFDLFRVGVGPSSSHTVGPMRASYAFVHELEKRGILKLTKRVSVTLFGSLAATGRGHATPEAVLLGLSGFTPEAADIAHGRVLLANAQLGHPLVLGRIMSVNFELLRDLKFSSACLPGHPNGMELNAIDGTGRLLMSEKYYSIGGGFITKDPMAQRKESESSNGSYSFDSARQLLEICESEKLSVAELMYRRECQHRSPEEIFASANLLLDTMDQCVQRGLVAEGSLPGSLEVRRRAKALYSQIEQKASAGMIVDNMSWLSVFAMAVSEENACGGQVVTAPTNGAAGIIPSVLTFYKRFIPSSSTHGAIDFLLTAGAIGILYKLNASISGAEVGCQGEIGVACSMAAAGLCAAMGGTVRQVENAAEIAMEHHLGLTCDPVGGRVQIPCIERNAMGAIKAVNAASLALMGDGSHFVSLDKVIETMMQTGRDMQSKYKETSLGGLAVSVVEC